MKIRLLKDIYNPYYGIKYKTGDIVLVKCNYGCSKQTNWQVIEILGFGNYIYAKEGEWEEVVENEEY